MFRKTNVSCFIHVGIASVIRVYTVYMYILVRVNTDTRFLESCEEATCERAPRLKIHPSIDS